MSGILTAQGKKIMVDAITEDLNARNPFIKEDGVLKVKFDRITITYYRGYVRTTYFWKGEEISYSDVNGCISFGDSVNLYGFEGKMKVTVEI